MEEMKVLKNGSKQIFKVGQKMYTESVGKLHAKYNESYKSVSFTIFFKTKPFYCHLPSEREKQTCLCITCSSKYLKRRSYVDNCKTLLPLMNENYSGKFIELNFSQNLRFSLRPKDEVQSAHFLGKQFTLHCAIVEPVENRYHYHLSNDTKHDGLFVDQVL